MSKVLSSQPLAEGRTAEIYIWDEQHVLKLYRDWCPPDWVDYEVRVVRAVHEAGIPSPEPGEIVEVEGRRGLIYERLEGISMLQDMNARPWRLWKHARALAELQITIHQKSIAGLPSYKDRLRYEIRQSTHIPDQLREKALARLDLLPDGVSLCHGDYHPGNVFLTHGGPVVIDWMTACSGAPSADVARTSMILDIGAKAAGRQVRPILRMAIKLYQRAYLSRYRSLSNGPADESERWSPVIAAARLNENITPERQALIQMVGEG
jgi:uncharacterized protein (TIGR02172 family)